MEQQQQAQEALFKISKANGTSISTVDIATLCNLRRETIYRITNGLTVLPTRANAVRILNVVKKIERIRDAWEISMASWYIFPKELLPVILNKAECHIMNQSWTAEEKLDKLTASTIRAWARVIRSRN